jgi:hypothetical protein
MCEVVAKNALNGGGSVLIEKRENTQQSQKSFEVAVVSPLE